MARAKPRSITHASAVGSPLTAGKLNKLRDRLIKRNLPADGVASFIRSVNPAIVFAYTLYPKMSSNRDRIEWLKRTERVLRELNSLLTLADGEDRQLLDPLTKRVPVNVVLDRVTARHKHIKGLPQEGKGHGSQQRLANELAGKWLEHLRLNPTASVADSKSNKGAVKISPFIEALRDVIHSYEKPKLEDELTEDALKGLAQRAIADLKKRIAMERLSNFA